MNDTQGRHNAILENRQRLQLSGVTDVDSFDEDEIRLFTQLGAVSYTHLTLPTKRIV